MLINIYQYKRHYYWLKLPFSCLAIVIAAIVTSIAQKSEIRIYTGKEAIGDYVHAVATSGTAYRYSLNKYLYAESFLRIGFGGRQKGDVMPPRASNYVGTSEGFAFEQNVEHDPLDKGLHRTGYNTHLITVINGYQIGIQTGKDRKFRLYSGAGLSIGYMDLQTLGEAGDAIFSTDGKETLIWYSLPAYQRGIGLQWSFSIGAEKLWKEWFLGLRGDLDAGGFGAWALGTRLSVAISAGIRL